jgi:hypothetical protein
MEDEDAAEVLGITGHFDGPHFAAVKVGVYCYIIIYCFGWLLSRKEWLYT